MAFYTHVTQPRPVVAQATCARTKPRTCAVETPSISSAPNISVAMATTSGSLQAVFVARHLRGVEWWGKVMPAVGTPLMTAAGVECAYAVRFTIPYHPGSAVAAKLWHLRRFAAATNQVGPRMTWILVSRAVEASMFLKIRACVAGDQWVVLW